MKNEKVIGIVGGMGPESGIMLCSKITSFTSATKDQDHLSIILMSFPKYISDRTAFLRGDVEMNPAFQIMEIISKLEKAGANLIGMACNTAHSEEIFNVIVRELNKKGSTIKLFNMPVATCNILQEKHPTLKRVGVVSTNGTYKSGVYHKLLEERGYEVVLPDFSFQNNVIHKMIYDSSIGIKANPNICTTEVKKLIDKAISFFKSKNVEAIILGCTELSLVFPQKIDDILLIDSITSLAMTLVKEASFESKEKLFSDDLSLL